MRFLLPLLLCVSAFGQVGNGCSSNTSANTGSVQSFAFCQPSTIDGRLKGGWIGLNRAGDLSNTEGQCYSPQNIFIQNGVLTIIDRSLSETCHYWPAQAGTANFSASFVSGMIQWSTFAFTGGDVLIRAKGPANVATGAWPVIFLLGQNCIDMSRVSADNGTFNGRTCNWHSTGSEEVDIFEEIGGGSTTNADCSFFFNTTTRSGTGYSLTDSSANWHVYELRWVAGASMQWWLDGVHTTICDTTAADTPNTPMFLQMNVAMNTGATSAGLPSSLQVDWVKVCQPSPCNGNGGNILFYDDFVTPIAISLIRPTARVARMSGASLPPSAVFTMGVAKNEEPKFK